MGETDKFDPDYYGSSPWASFFSSLFFGTGAIVWGVFLLHNRQSMAHSHLRPTSSSEVTWYGVGLLVFGVLVFAGGVWSMVASKGKTST